MAFASADRAVSLGERSVFWFILVCGAAVGLILAVAMALLTEDHVAETAYGAEEATVQAQPAPSAPAADAESGVAIEAAGDDGAAAMTAAPVEDDATPVELDGEVGTTLIGNPDDGGAGIAPEGSDTTLPVPSGPDGRDGEAITPG